MKKFFILTVLLMPAGYMNMPTPTSQITGTQASTAKYGGWNCMQLAHEMNALARREN